MSNKGKVFTPDDLPDSARRKTDDAAAIKWAEEQTARYRIVAIDETEPDPARQPIIAEELDQRAINKLSAKARRVVGTMMHMAPETRLEIINAFDQAGALKHPFKMT